MKIYLNKELQDGVYIGIDAAAKTGWAVIFVRNKVADLIDFGSISLERNIPELVKFEIFENTFNVQLSKYLKHSEVTIAIEDCFLGKWNPKTFKLLARLEGYLIHYFKTVKRNVNITLMPPLTARKIVGAKKIKGKYRKKKLVNFVNFLLKKQHFTEKHHDICDAIILALSVAIKEGKK